MLCQVFFVTDRPHTVLATWSECPGGFAVEATHNGEARRAEFTEDDEVFAIVRDRPHIYLRDGWVQFAPSWDDEDAMPAPMTPSARRRVPLD
jgi:hypothetical protein